MKMEFIDTHTHLFLDEFRSDIDAVIERATNENITKFFLPNIDAVSVNPLMKLCRKRKNICYPMLGLHPCSVIENFEKDLEVIKNSINDSKPYAIGEMGLDLYWDKSTYDLQVEAFNIQADWAKSYNLPIVLHSRNATRETIDLAAKTTGVTGVFHCFSGTLDEAMEIISMGFYLGIGGVITYKNSGLDKIVEEVGLANIVLETDAPYLAPAPFRGKRNESSYLKIIALKVAEVTGENLNMVAEVTTQNAKTLFKIS